MKYLANYKEFKNSKSETSNFRIPYAAIEWKKDDKIYNYFRKKLDQCPLWGVDLIKQDKNNSEVRNVDNENIDFEIDFSETIFESENIDIEITKHGEDRSNKRYGKEVNINKNMVIDLINKCKDTILKSSSKFETFVIHSLKSKLNIVGALVKTKGKYLFKVITVMIKDVFYPKSDDKYIEIAEGLVNDDNVIIYAI
jgi:hypothetical protein